MSTPLVSVVVPSYNHARFLEERLRSVLDQTERETEVIVLDDASSDDSVAVVGRFQADRRVRLIANRVNGGSPFKQWNRGVAEARGRYVWIAESDDRAAPRLLETLVARLEANPSAGLAYCQSRLIGAGGEQLGTGADLLQFLPRERWEADFANDGRDECARYLLLENSIPNASAVVFRRELYRQMGGADEGMRLCGDWMAWVGLLLRSDVVFVASPLNDYRMHPAALRRTTSLEVSATEGWRVISRILGEVQPAAADLRALRTRLANEWASVTVQRHKRAFDEELRQLRQLGRGDPWFALRTSAQVLRYFWAAARKRIPGEHHRRQEGE